MSVKHQPPPPGSKERAQLRIAVVGTGLLGERHARFWGQQDNVDLVGLIDLDIPRATSAAQRLAGTFGIPRPPVFTSLDARPDAMGEVFECVSERPIDPSILLVDGAVLRMTHPVCFKDLSAFPASVQVRDTVFADDVHVVVGEGRVRVRVDP